MISYTAGELLALQRTDVIPPRAARRRRFRRHRIPAAITQQQQQQQPSADHLSGGSTRFGFLNIRSLLHKADEVCELLSDRSIDVLCLAETWHDADSVCIRRLRSSGFHVVDFPRPRPPATAESLGVNHGGVAVIAAGGARLSVVPVDVHPTTLEYVSVRVDINRHVCTVVTVYRPGSEFVQSAFFGELAVLLDTVATRAEPVYSTSDSIVLTTRTRYA